MKSEQVITFFSEIVTHKPELFQGNILKDLTRLERVLDESEIESEPERIESVTEAIIEFCDVNPEIHSQLTEMALEPGLNHPQTSGESQVQLLSECVKKVLDLHLLNHPHI
ncbi:conserved hypothetical protein [Planktothrix serta PCC 8927]|uniref:Uncharacterized protein n=1 Tax=Planktothrix serta PCC 8927 TaxID=671068 RepID=A0A7Z9DZN6_9CYAN|nr:hypothetical protein [Planktothrix serta]VXD17905.1 conserved hypothetical protein [Planktothrix serta PCC 8927]